MKKPQTVKDVLAAWDAVDTPVILPEFEAENA